MRPSLQSIARAVGGHVVGDHVVTAYPGKPKRDRSVSIFVNGDDIGVHLFRDGDPIAVKDHFRQICGLPAWKPTRLKRKMQALLSVRRSFLSETLRVCRHRKTITPAAFDLLVNDARVVGDDQNIAKYAREFGFGPADVERCMAKPTQRFTADERAEILELKYEERMRLELRRTGATDVDREGRERARHDRDNAKRRVKRHAASEAAKKLASIGSQVQKSLKEENATDEFDDDETIDLKVAIETAAASPVEFLSKSGSKLNALERAAGSNKLSDPISIRPKVGSACSPKFSLTSSNSATDDIGSGVADSHVDHRYNDLPGCRRPGTPDGIDRRGKRSPETLAAIEQRDRFLLAMRDAHYSRLSVRETARCIYRDIDRYRAFAWRRDRAETTCPDRFVGRPQGYCWAILKCFDRVPCDTTIRNAITVFDDHGRRQNEDRTNSEIVE